MEQSFLFAINRDWTHPVLDRLMAVVSSWDFWWPILLVAGLVIFIRGGFRGRAMLVCCGVAIFFTDAVVVRSLKKIIGKPRPHMVLEGIRQVDLAKAKPRILAIAEPLRISVSEGAILPVSGGSFPSGHSANNFAIATVVFLFFRRWGWLMFAPALLVAYSRVYVGAHWPGDVILSAFLGAGLACLSTALVAFVYQVGSAKWFPRLHNKHPTLL